MPTVTRHPSSNAVGTTGFTNPGNAYSSNDSYATAAPSMNSTISSYFGGFDFASYIPAGSQIHSVTISIERKMSTTASSASTTQLAYDNTTAIGTVQTSTAEPTSDTIWTSSPSSLPTVTQLRSADFRVLVGAKRGAGATGYTMSLDDVYVTVDYTPAPSSPVVQVKRKMASTFDSTTLSFDTLPTVGNLIVVMAVTYGGSLAAGSVTDNQSHSYTQRGKIEANSGTDNGELCQYHTTVVNSSGTFTITLNPDGSSAECSLIIMEISGRASSPYDTDVTAQAGSDSGSASTGNITPSENNCLLVAAVGHTYYGVPAITETLSGCTLIDELEDGVTYMPFSLIVKLQTTATAEAATWTIGTNVEWYCSVVSYKAAGASEISGTAAITLDGLTCSAAGTVDIAGAASITLDAMTSSSAGTVEIAGAAAITLGVLTSSAVGTVDISGAFSQALDSLSLAASGTVENGFVLHNLMMMGIGV